MTALLGHLYSTNLSEDEKIKVDENTKKARQRFASGFLKGGSVSLTAYSFYLLTRSSPAHAVDGGVPKPPGDFTSGIAKQPKPPTTPWFQPLTGARKPAFVGGTGAIFANVLEDGDLDFFLGVAIAFMFAVAGILLSRDKP